MDAFAQSSPENRRAGFVQTAAARRMDPIIVEKDFWVCWTLKELFRLPEMGGHLIFKGATSLSKVFNVIDRAFLGFGGANEPEAAASNKEKQRRIEALKAACQQKIAGVFHPALETAIKSKIAATEAWSLRNDEEDPDQQTLLFEYPSSFAANSTGYIRRMVKIELGAGRPLAV